MIKKNLRKYRDMIKTSNVTLNELLRISEEKRTFSKEFSICVDHKVVEYEFKINI